ncbi:MAG: hypothetical protein AB7S26_37190 [Sandaracinaceae bacterium]
MRDPRLQRWIGHSLTAAILAFTASTATLDAHYEWDQHRILDAERDSVAAVAYVQPDRTWNGMAYDPTFFVAAVYLVPKLPQIISEIAHNPRMPLQPGMYPTLAEWQHDMFRRIGTEAHKVEVRRVHLALGLIAVLFVYLTVLRLFPGRYAPAVGSVAFLALSWEVVMHFRWTEVDVPMTTGITLFAYLVACGITARTREAAMLHAIGVGVAAGLVIACKVSGVWALAVGGLSVVRFPYWTRVRDRAALVLAMSFGAIATYATLSPASFADPIGTLTHAFHQVADYRSIPEDYPVYVAPPWGHLARICEWLFLYQPSHVPVFALALSLVAVVGLYALVRDRRRFALTAGVYPVLVLAMMTRLPLFQLRNYLHLVPFFAIGFAAGLVYLSTLLRKPWMRHALAAAVVGIFAFNAGWLVYADHSMRTTTRDVIVAEAERYLAETDDAQLVSPRAYRETRATLDARFTCARPGPDETAPWVLIYYQDHHPLRWRAATPGFVERWFAPLETDFDWLTLWKGRFDHHRMALLSRESAEAMHVETHAFLLCRPR